MQQSWQVLACLRCGGVRQSLVVRGGLLLRHAVHQVSWRRRRGRGRGAPPAAGLLLVAVAAAAGARSALMNLLLLLRVVPAVALLLCLIRFLLLALLWGLRFCSDESTCLLDD